MNHRESLAQALNHMGRLNHVIRDTHGNLSCIDRSTGVVYIKPSGVAYDQITPETICSIAIFDEGEPPHTPLRPSVDTPHHLSIYRRHPWVGAICHTHSPHVVAHAIASLDIPCTMTEQADYFGGDVRVLAYRDLDSWGGHVVLDPGERAIVLGHHGALTFADSPMVAVKLAAALENVAEKNVLARVLDPSIHRLRDGEAERWHRRYRDSYGQR